MHIFKKIKESYYYSGLSSLIQRIIDMFFLVPFYHVLHKSTIEFTGAKPENGKSYIIVSNHRSMKDPPLLGHSLALPVAFIAKKELFENPLLKIFLSLTSTISVDRESVELQTFKEAKKALAAKSCGLAWNIGIFIEGTRSIDPDSLGKPNKGAIFIARMTKIPIIPVGISYRDNGKSIIVKIGEAYEIDYKRDLDEQAWECLNKISELCDYQVPVSDDHA